MKSFFILIVFIFSFHAYGQPTVKVEVSSDTVVIGEMVEIIYTIENGDGKLDIPDMRDLPVISGPNTSSSFIYQNGKMNSSQSYSFKLMPMEEGKLIIPEASYQTRGEALLIQPVEVIVLSRRDKPAASSKAGNEPSPIKTTREKRKF